MSDKKLILRAEAKKHRERMHYDIEDVEHATGLFWTSVKPATGNVIAGYWPKGREFDPSGILEKALKSGHRCCLPVIQRKSRILKFALWNDNIPLEEGPFGILQPRITSETRWLTPDIVIVPLLAFDQKGNRLGYGGGYYDATLSSLREEKDILAVGVAYAQQACLFKLPTEEHDQPLDWVITPQKPHAFVKERISK